jgi:hypothetical protein
MKSSSIAGEDLQYKQAAMPQNTKLDSRDLHASSSGEEDEINECEFGANNTKETIMIRNSGSQQLYERMCISGKSEAMKWERAAMNLEDEVRDQTKENYTKNHRRERDVHLLEAENIKEDSDAPKFETEKLRKQCEENGKLEDQLSPLKQKFKNITKKRDSLLLEGRTIAENIDTLIKDRPAIILEIKRLRAQRKTAALLEEQLKFARKQYDDIAKETDTFRLKCRRS